MADSNCVEITSVEPASIADELGVEAEDKLLEINGNPIKDYIDYKFLITDLYLEVLIEKSGGEEWLLEIEKDYDEDLGLEFDGIIYDGLKKCNNNCIFCFINQSPPGLRETLNLKDDDYRFSFLQGSYITLTNLEEEELNRIKRLHLSPLYVSVHTTNPELRQKMMRNPAAGDILVKLKELAEVGIEFHTQIVLCPEVNDGAELERTISDLVTLFPAIKSLAIVPVGLTKFREDLSSLRSFSGEEASKVIKQVKRWQKKLKAKKGKNNFLYLADEFYLLANESIPPVEHYDNFPQFENGVGMIRLFWEQFEEVKDKLPLQIERKQEFTLVTGELGEVALQPVVDRLNQIEGLIINLLVVSNEFFGREVTVAGLLTGEDIIREIKQNDIQGKVVIPQLLLNEAGLFIDNLQVDDLKAEFPELDFIVVENHAAKLVDDLLDLN